MCVVSPRRPADATVGRPRKSARCAYAPGRGNFGSGRGHAIERVLDSR